MQRLDHAMIFVLIAGTYTPLCTLSMSRWLGVSLLIGVWLVAIVGFILKIMAFDRYVFLNVALYPVLERERPDPWPSTSGYHEIWHTFTPAMNWHRPATPRQSLAGGNGFGPCVLTGCHPPRDRRALDVGEGSAPVLVVVTLISPVRLGSIGARLADWPRRLVGCWVPSSKPRRPRRLQQNDGTSLFGPRDIWALETA